MKKLHIQNYLDIGYAPEKLTEQFGIAVKEHPTLPLLNFKYSQIDSPKSHPIVRESRGIVLERGTWRVVAKPFTRFFNFGENVDNWADFVKEGSHLIDKEDGSLIILYYYKDDWRINTSGSFGLDNMGAYKDWQEFFWACANFSKSDLAPYKGMTLLFEICSMDNQVVLIYDKPKTYLIGLVDNEQSFYEFTEPELDSVAAKLNCDRPRYLVYTNQGNYLDFVKADISKKEADLHEGLILRDKNNLRFKWKTQKYLTLHRMSDNGNLALPKNLIPVILNNEQDEVLAYFPSLEGRVNDIAEDIEDLRLNTEKLWQEHKDLPLKEFAMAVKDSESSGLLFTMKRKGSTLKELWSSDNVSLVKLLVKRMKDK